MGANLCCIRRSCARGPAAAAAAASGDGLEFAGYEIREWRRLQWRRRRRRREKLEVKREKEASIEIRKEYMSLEELMLASPGAAPSELGFGNGGGGGGFKRKVHPARITNGSSLFCEDEYSGGDFSICRSESGKMKKKVSFRLPEVSDVIVIYSPAADAPADDVNVGS